MSKKNNTNLKNLNELKAKQLHLRLSLNSSSENEAIKLNINTKRQINVEISNILLANNKKSFKK